MKQPFALDSVGELCDQPTCLKLSGHKQQLHTSSPVRFLRVPLSFSMSSRASRGSGRMTAKALEKQADSAVQGIVTVGQSALEAALADFDEKMRQDPGLFWTLKGQLDHGTLGALLQQDCSSGALPPCIKNMPKRKKIRQSAKRWKHLEGSPIVWEILQFLEPTIFMGESESDRDVLETLLYALNANLETEMPHLYLEKGTFTDELADIAKARYVQCGSRFRGKTLALAKEASYFMMLPDSKNSVVLTRDPEKKVDFEFAETVELKGRLQDATVICQVGGKSMSMALLENFKAIEGVEFMSEDDHWELEDFAERVLQPAGEVSDGTPTKKLRAFTPADKASWINDTLRKRLAEQTKASVSAASSSSAKRG